MIKYMLTVEGEAHPKVKHVTYDSANKEAHRLAVHTGKVVTIYKSVEEFQTHSPQVYVTKL